MFLKHFILWKGEGCQSLSTGSSQQKVGVEADLGGCLGGQASATTAANAPLHCLEPLSWSLSPSAVSEIESVHCLSVRSHVTCNFFSPCRLPEHPKAVVFPTSLGHNVAAFAGTFSGERPLRFLGRRVVFRQESSKTEIQRS